MVHVIITGGSSGIGKALARIYLKRGDVVTVIGRSAERLQLAEKSLLGDVSEATGRVRIAACDVADEDALQTVIAESEASFGPCDILITSAGVVHPAIFEDLDSALFSSQISTNLMGTANAVRAVYRGMKLRRRGTILLVSSGAALIGIHGYTAYCASKSAVAGFAEALRMEAAPYGVGVVIAYPPDTDTPQLAAEIPQRSRQASLVMQSVRPWTPEAVARRMIRGLDRGQPTIYFGLTLNLLGRFGSLVKPLIYQWFLWRDPER